MSGPIADSAGDSVWESLRDQMRQLEASRLQPADPQVLLKRMIDRANRLRSRIASPAEQQSQPYLTFRLAQDRFGIPLRDVIEIQTLDHYSPVPGSPEFIVGVIPWRGSLLALVDLERLFGIRHPGIADYHVCVVVEAAGRRLAIATREVEDIVGIAADQISHAPTLHEASPADWITGIHDGNRMLVSLETMLQDDNLEKWKRRASC